MPGVHNIDFISRPTAETQSTDEWYEDKYELKTWGSSLPRALVKSNEGLHIAFGHLLSKE